MKRAPFPRDCVPGPLQAREALRSVIASLDQRYREQVHDLETVPLIVRESLLNRSWARLRLPEMF
jgi:hypothetical protein